MAQNDSDESKIHDPTPRKLEQAREKGEIPRSADLTTAIGYGGVLLAALGVGSLTVERLGALGVTLLAGPGAIADQIFGGSGTATHGAVLSETVAAILPIFAVPFLLVLLGLLAQRSLLFTPDKLAPKLSRISPISNAQQKYGLSGLFEFAKSFVKLIVISAALAIYVASVLDDIVMSTTLEPRGVALLTGRLAVEFLAIVVAIAFAIGGIDLVWQIADHKRRNRMSHKEIMDEMKESEGDPYLKERRRQKGYEIAQNQMMAKVPEASVIVVNPTHFAVALAWDAGADTAPTCVAKGVDEIAARIREIADAHDIPIHSDPPTARALYAALEIGDEIAPQHYAQVAAAIRFADAVRARHKASPL